MKKTLRLFILTLVMGLMSVSVVAQDFSGTYTIDLTKGSFTKSNANGTWHSEWSSSEVSGLKLSLNANNMCADNEDANLLCIYSGQSGTCSVAFVAPAGYVVKSYSFDHKLRSDNQTASITLNVNGANYTCAVGNQHVDATAPTDGQAMFTQTGANKGVTYSNFTVTIEKGELELPFQTTTIVNGAFAEGTKWYTMKIKNQFYITDNAGADKIVVSGHGRTDLADSDLWCFTGDEENGYQIYNKQAGATKVLASSTEMMGTTGGSTFPTLQPADALPANYVGVWDFNVSTDFSGVNGFYIALRGHASSIMNLRDGNLAFWTGGSDAGSTIVITDMEDVVVEENVCYVFDNAGSTIPYRIPAIAQASNGNLIAVADYRYSKGDIGSGALDLRYRISTDHGKTWGDIKTLVSKNYNGGGNLHTGYGDPCIVADRESGRVLVMSCSGNVMFPNGQRNNHQGIARFYSYDNGETWSVPHDLSDSIYALFDNCTIGTARSMFVGSGKISQSKTIKVGDYYRIYCAILFKDAAGTNKNYALYSDDFGETWSVLGGVNVAPIPSGADEPKAEELPDGSVLVSSRVSYGRQYNVFHYSNVETGEGEWTVSTFSGSANNGVVGGGGNPVNGEILVVPVKRNSDNKNMYLLLQSLQFGDNRTNVGIYYKELASTADFSSGETVAKNWDGRLQVSNTTSAYTTMVQMDNDTIAFFYEENAYNGGYDMIYKTFSIDSLTNKAYSATNEPVSLDTLKKNALAQEWADVADCVGDKVGNITSAGYASIEAAYEICAANYSEENYAAFKQAISEAETVQLSDRIKYRLRNKLYPTKYLVINASTMTIATLNEANENQLVSFVANEDGTWKIYGEAVNGYVGNTGANETQIPVGAAGASYLVVSNVAGESYLECTTPGGPHPAIHAAGDNIRIVPWTTAADASRWYIEPTDITTDLESVVSESNAAPEVFYDLSGRRVENPKQGIYVTSRKRKVVVK